MESVAQVPLGQVLANLLLGGLALALVIYLPGALLLWRRLPDRTPSLERWVLTATAGLGSVALATATLLLLPVRLLGVDGVGWPPYLVAASAAGLALLGWRLNRGRRPVKRAVTTPGDRVALGLAAGVFALFFVGIDGQAHTPWCFYEPADQLMQGPPTDVPSPLLELGTYERLGNVALNLVPYGLFRAAGPRAASGLFAALMMLSVTALARRAAGPTWAGLAAAVALVLTGDVFGSEVVNVNVIAAWLAAVFLLLLHPAYGATPVFRTAAAALLFGSRYLTLLGMGAAVFVLLRDRAEGESAGATARRLAGHAALFALLSLPVHVFHLATMGTPLLYRAWEEYGAQPHGLLGFDFTLHTMLNAPLYGDLVRTPFNPFPMWIGWPVHVVGQWGALGAALILLGGGVLVARSQRDRTWIAWALYTIPVALFLGIQENWMQPEKMTIGLVLAPLFAAALAAALAWLAGGGVRLAAGALVGITVIAGCWLGGRALERASFPEDPRYRAEYPALRGETDAFHGFVRDRWLAPRWVPLPRDAGMLRSLGRKVGETRAVVGHPGFRDRRISAWAWLLGTVDPTLVTEPRRLDHTYEAELRAARGRPLPASTAPRVIELGLADSPMVASSPLSPSDTEGGHARLDLADGRRCATTGALRFAFLDRPGRVVACRTDDDRIYVAVTPPPPPPSDEEVEDCDADHDDERELAFCRAVLEARGRATWDPAAFDATAPTASVRLSVPSTTRELVLVEIVHLVPMRIYVRDVQVGYEILHGPPREWRHN